MSKGKAGSPPVEQPEGRMAEKKRKRPAEEPDDEIEIDVNLPEPPSKKAKRKEKKAEKQKTKTPPANSLVKDGTETAPNGDPAQPANTSTTPAKQRTDYGIWIGNLPFSVMKEDLRKFLSEEGGISNDDIVRVHLPPPKDSSKKGDKNCGFAYIDFTTQAGLDKALQLSERLLSGRRVLIKNAKNFEGRPAKADEGKSEAANAKAKSNGTKEPSKRIFVGNLGFDVTREEIREHFSQAGEVEDVFLATFEDSGKCKGFGWVRFAEIEAAEAAVKGFIFKDLEDLNGDADADGDGGDETVSDKSQPKAKREKRRKWFINRLYGRELRCEFAEDAHTRYKKRFGKEGKSSKAEDVEANDPSMQIENRNRATQRQNVRKPPKSERKTSMNQDERRDERRKRHEKMDARKIAPGKALSDTPRASGAIVAAAGKKISFD